MTGLFFDYIVPNIHYIAVVVIIVLLLPSTFGKAAPIEYKPLTFGRDEALQSIEYAVLAYSNPDQSQDEWKHCIESRGEWVDVKVFQAGEIDAFVGETRDAIYVALRGTQGITDVVSDLKASKTSAPHGRAHKGFYRFAHTLYYRLGLRHFVKTRTKKIYIAGHSLAGAAGIELAGIMLADGIRPAGVLALCAPRSSNHSRARWLSKELQQVLIRVLYCRDIVPMVPFRFMFFCHVGETMYFDKDGRFHPLISSHGRLLDLIGGIIRDRKAGRNFDFLRYHSASTVAELTVNAIRTGRLELPSSVGGATEVQSHPNPGTNAKENCDHETD